MKELTGKQVAKRLFLYLFIAILVFIAGICVGYLFIGHGSWKTLLDSATWHHLVQFFE